VSGSVAWRASVAADGAGDADFAGLKASLNAEETRSINFVNAYEHYGAYTAYSRYIQLGDLLEKEVDSNAGLSEEEAFLLDRQRAEAYDLADANQDLFPNRFLNRDGSYSVQREMGEAWADAAKEKDLNPDPQYAEAEKPLQESLRRLEMQVKAKETFVRRRAEELDEELKAKTEALAKVKSDYMEFQKKHGLAG